MRRLDNQPSFSSWLKYGTAFKYLESWWGLKISSIISIAETVKINFPINNGFHPVAIILITHLIPALLSVLPLLVTIDSPPAPAPLTANTTNTLSCTSYGSNPPAVISWWLDGVRISSADSQVSIFVAVSCFSRCHKLTRDVKIRYFPSFGVSCLYNLVSWPDLDKILVNLDHV